MATMPLHEVRSALVETRDRIADKNTHYEYTDWTQCTCGHLYQTTMEKVAYRAKSVSNPGRNRYGRLMKALSPIIPTTYALQASNPAIRLSSFVCGNGRSRAVGKLNTLIETFDAHYGPVGMNIGEESPARTITPRENPVPTEVPEREQIPSREPTRTPERSPEQVPTR